MANVVPLQLELRYQILIGDSDSDNGDTIPVRLELSGFSAADSNAQQVAINNIKTLIAIRFSLY